MDRISKYIIHLLVSLLIFIIPANLALNLSRENVTINGILVDYLIPKLYISDIIAIPLIILLYIAVFKKVNLSIKKAVISFSPVFVASLALILILVVNVIQAPRDMSAMWFFLKLIQWTTLTLLLIQYKLPLTIFKKPLVVTLLFQSVVAILQWIQKQSLIGYLFLGESHLSTSSYVAKTIYGGEVRPLPYGTTAHPNILAGFLVIGLLILIAVRLQLPQPKQKLIIQIFRSILVILFLLIVLTALYLTQSLSAIVALIIGAILFRGKSIHPQNLLAIIGIVAATLFVAIPYVETESITRRSHLINVSLEMIKANPLLGVGLNNFTIFLPQFGEVPGTVRFFQPVHNIFILWATETGLVATGIVLLLLFLNRHKLFQFVKVDSKKIIANWPLKIPLLMLLFIGFFDHYPFTLQSGQLMTVLTTALFLYDSVDAAKVELGNEAPTGKTQAKAKTKRRRRKRVRSKE